MDDTTVLRERFGEVYPRGGEPAVCRAPGRVNIIGEHTDYNGLPVLPMTIGQEIRIAFAPRADNQIRLSDTDDAFPSVEFTNSSCIPPSRRGNWENYCKAAVQGLNAHFANTQFPGMNLLVSGTIPIAAGLSSSSALVVACALAYLHVCGKRLGGDISRLDLAGLMAESEHYVGTRGGGMDQTVILTGGERVACKIDFFPLQVETVPLPESHVFVVCNSLVKAQKTGEMLHRYNAGPRLCQLICAMVERRAQEEFGDEVEIQRLGDLWRGHLCLTHAEVTDLFADTFPDEVDTLAEAARRLRLSEQECRTRWLGDLIEPKEGLRLQARARHQLTEYQRVETTRDALLEGDVARVGAMMDASHESCARDFGISCPELEKLVGIARKAGALGARLTGAGFGGCTVNLVAREHVEAFEKEVRNQYYDRYLAGRSLDSATAMFVALPSGGAGYL